MRLIPLLPLLAFTAFAETSTSASASAGGSLLPGGADAWSLVWSDEFEDGEAGFDARWISQNEPSGHILSSRWRENVAVRDGTVRLMNRKEARGGQQWTSGSIWTRERFQYGYFECRYRYAAATGTNNSFWLMGPQDIEPARGKNLEIDINEGHYPNEINTNIHNWTGMIPGKGRRGNKSDSRSFSFGIRPDVTIQLEIPVTTNRIRLTSRHPAHFHIREFRIYDVNTAGYPAPLSESADTDVTGLVNHARDPGTRVLASGFHQGGPDTSGLAADGSTATSWVSQAEGEKSLEFVFPGPRTVGCIQFLSGWIQKGAWRDMLENYEVEYFNGTSWVGMARFSLRDGSYNFARDFHTYGLEWTPNELVFYFNGKEIRREANLFCHSPASVYLSLAIIAWAGKVTDAIDGTQMEADYVRVYHPKNAPTEGDDAPRIVAPNP